MSDRVIRDELLTSDRYWRCSAEARSLYLSILLSADDCGRYTGANFALRVRCMAGTVDAERVEKLLAELHDADLVRLYTSNDERFIFVPRFRQRLRYKRSKYPEPPPEINDLPKEKSDLSRPKSDLSASKDRPKTAEVKRSEEKKNTVSSGDDSAFAEFWLAYPRKTNKQEAAKRWRTLKPDDGLRSRIMAALTLAKASDQWRRGVIPHASTWLNKRRWDDELESVAEERRWI